MFDELGSSASIKAIATSMVTAGAIQGLSTSGLLPDNLANATNGKATLPNMLGRQLIDNTASAVIRSGINGTSLEDELQQEIVTAFLNTAAAQGANWIGDNGPQGNQSLNAFAAETAHAIVGCGIGAARAGNGGGCAAGALGAVAGHLASGAMPGMDPNEVLAVSQLIGGLAWAVAGQGEQGVYIGAGAAGNAVANNRQLHPSELELEKTLYAKAQKDGLPYTLQEIEAQMRLMGNDAKGVSPNHGEIFWNTANDPKALAALQNNLANDPSMPKGVEGNSVYEILGTPNAAIQAFVAGNTKDNTSYIPGVSPYVPSNTGFGNVMGSPAESKTRPCANLNFGCTSGVGVQQKIPLTPEQQQMVGAYFGKASSDYQRAAAISTPAGNAPVALSFEIAVGLTGLLEQAFTPSAGKVILDSVLVDSLAKTFSERTGVPLFLVNEVAEREIKPRLQSGRSAIDQFATGKK